MDRGNARNRAAKFWVNALASSRLKPVLACFMFSCD